MIYFPIVIAYSSMSEAFQVQTYSGPIVCMGGHNDVTLNPLVKNGPWFMGIFFSRMLSDSDLYSTGCALTFGAIASCHR